MTRASSTNLAVMDSPLPSPLSFSSPRGLREMCPMELSFLHVRFCHASNASISSARSVFTCQSLRSACQSDSVSRHTKAVAAAVASPANESARAPRTCSAPSRRSVCPRPPFRYTTCSVVRKYLREFPEKMVKIPIKFPTSTNFPHNGEY